MLFKNRIDAGLQLAQELKKRSFRRPIVIALPRGGVPVAQKIAEALNAPLDVLVVRKIGMPGQEDIGVGAVTEGDLTLFNDQVLARPDLNEADLEDVVEREMVERDRWVMLYRAGRALSSVKGRSVILVDDGFSNRYGTAVAAELLQDKGAAQVTLAVPVCASDWVELLENFADRVLCLKQPEPYLNAGRWYDHFEQTTDQEVITILKKNRQNQMKRNS